MNEDWLAIRIAETLRRWKLRLVPEGGHRARGAAIVSRALLRLTGDKNRIKRLDPAAHCVTLPGWVIPPLPPGGRVLLLKLDHIGDLVLTLPALRVLRDGLPDAEITLLCGSWNVSLAKASGCVDRVAAFDFFASRSGQQFSPPDRPALIAQFAALAAELGAFDLAVDFRHEPDTRSLLAAVSTPVRAGFSAYGDARASLNIALANTEQVASGLGNGRPMHAQTRMSMLAHAVIDAVRPAGAAVRCLVKPDAKAFLDRPYAVLAPGAGAPLRAWPVARLAELARALVERHGLHIVILGGLQERPLAAAILSALPPGAGHDLTERMDIADVPAVLNFARLFVGMDSGLTHLAGALAVPSVCIFSGVSRREVWQATGPRMTVVAGCCTCSPCYLARPEQCPHAQACLTVIGVDDVLRACEARLAGQAADGLRP